MAWGKMKEVLQNRRFLLYWLGQSISGMGNWMTFVGLNLYVLQIFGSGKILGMFLVVRMLPSVFFGSIGGYLADKYDRKHMMMTCDLLRALIVVSFIFIRDIYVFFLMGLLLSVLDKFFLSARGAFIPQVVERERLLDANSLNETTTATITILGPALGALLVGFLDYRTFFLIDSATFAVSVLCLALIRHIHEKRTGDKARPGIIREFVEEYRAAFAFLKGHRTLLFLMLLRFTDAFGSGAYNVALPVFAAGCSRLGLPGLEVDIQKGAAYGLLVAVWASGQLLGSLLTKKLAWLARISHENLFSLSILTMAIGMGLTFQSSWLWVSLVFIFMGGVGDGISNVIFVNMLIRESPENMRGKLFGTLISLIYTTVSAGMLVSGWLIDRLGAAAVTGGASWLILAGMGAGRYFFHRMGITKRDGQTT
jgi:MFS family permease